MSQHGPTDTVNALRRAFARVVPPGVISQQAFDFDDGHLHSLVQLRAGDRADRSDLWRYAHDVLYTEIQSDLLRYLLPFCLEPNVEFLRRTLTVPAVVDVVERAMRRLMGEPEYAVAQRIRTEIPLHIVRLQSRCLELPRRLATIQDVDTSLDASPFHGRSDPCLL